MNASEHGRYLSIITSSHRRTFSSMNLSSSLVNPSVFMTIATSFGGKLPNLITHRVKNFLLSVLNLLLISLIGCLQALREGEKVLSIPFLFHMHKAMILYCGSLLCQPKILESQVRILTLSSWVTWGHSHPSQPKLPRRVFKRVKWKRFGSPPGRK